MDALKEEQMEVKCQDGVIVRQGRSNKALDEFFKRLEEDPDAFMAHNHMDIYRYTKELEKARCIRKITVFKARLEQLYEEYEAFQRELMSDPIYSEIQERILQDMARAISSYYELIDQYEEDILVLDWGED